MRPLGRRVPNLATKGPKGPICCQIWNGFRSIVSVFGSNVPPNASCVSQNGLKSAQRESKWLKMAQHTVKIAQNRFKMAQSGVKISQNWLKIAQNRPKMPQNRPKIVLRGQNKHLQNTADRKLRPNTPQGAVYAILVRPLGRRVPNLATKGPKGPICCQIWNGFKSIGSVFGSSVPPNASCVSQNGLKSAQK